MEVSCPTASTGFVGHFEVDRVPQGWTLESVDDGLVEGVREAGLGGGSVSLRPVQLIRAQTLDHLACRNGTTRIWLAWDGAQVTGSFKVRGAVCALRAARLAGERLVVAASAGNHGAGVAHAATALGMRAIIVVPASAPRSKLARMVGPGITLTTVPGGYDGAEAHARDLAGRLGARFVSPYDDDRVLVGNGASIALEVVAALGEVPAGVLAPIGGGGLATGLALGLDAVAGVRCRRVWGVQSEVCPAFALSWMDGKVRERMEAVGPTLAEGLEGGISRRSAARVASVVRGVSVVTEAAIQRAMSLLQRDYGLTVEGSGAAALVPLLDGLPPCLIGGTVVVVLTGSNVDKEAVAAVVGKERRC